MPCSRALWGCFDAGSWGGSWDTSDMGMDGNPLHQYTTFGGTDDMPAVFRFTKVPGYQGTRILTYP